MKFKKHVVDSGYGLKGLFSLSYLTIPFGITRTKWLDENQFMAWTDYLIFGFRVARVQENRPWAVEE